MIKRKEVPEQSLIEEIKTLLDKYTDAPDIYKEMAGYFIVSSILGPHAYTIYCGDKMRPNIYWILLGPSRIGRKSTILKYIRWIVKAVDNKYTIFMDATPEALIKHISENRLNKSLYLHPEFGSYYKAVNSKSYYEGFMSDFRLLYGGEEVTSHRKKEYIEIDEGFFLNAGCGIPTPITRYLKTTEDFHTGLLNRFLITLPEKFNDISDPFDIQEFFRDDNLFIEIVNKLTRLKSIFISANEVYVNFTPPVHDKLFHYESMASGEALKVLNENNVSVYDEEAYSKYYGEIVKYILKLSIVHRLSRAPYPENGMDERYAIEGIDLREAMKIIKHCNRTVIACINQICSEKVSKKIETSQQINKVIVDNIKSFDGDKMPRSELIRSKGINGMSAKELDEHIYTLIEQEAIERILEKTEGAKKNTIFYRVIKKS